MKKQVFIFEGPISYNKENINIAPPLGRHSQITIYNTVISTEAGNKVFEPKRTR